MNRLKLEAGELDLLAGCPPCQEFSTILNGIRDIDDYRNDLVLEFLRFIKELEPRGIMMENVPSLAEDNRLATFCREIESLGYSYECKILNAADLGVPQRRYRMVLLGGKSGPIKFAAPGPTRYTVLNAIAHLPPAGESGDPLHDLSEKRSARIAETTFHLKHVAPRKPRYQTRSLRKGKEQCS
jgi:DNA (cytosine-5)-methyltransferase 1